jgi:hypothetical protein
MNLNEYMVEKIARALGPLCESMVFVGGATVSLYVAAQLRPDVRLTKDVDLVIEILNYGELEELRDGLVKLGFFQTAEDDVPCRFRFEEIIVDVMSTKAVGWAPANPWFEMGYEHAIICKIGDLQIKLLTLPFFLATKFVAFHGLAKDPRTSHDLEDIAFLLDNHEKWETLIETSPPILRTYLEKEFQGILSDRKIQEGIEGNLPPTSQPERLAVMLDRMRKFVKQV